MVVERRGERESESEIGEVQGLVDSKIDEEIEFNKIQYRIAKEEAKNTVAVPKNNAYERLYQRLNSKEGENEVFKPARARGRRHEI